MAAYLLVWNPKRDDTFDPGREKIVIGAATTVMCNAVIASS